MENAAVVKKDKTFFTKETLLRNFSFFGLALILILFEVLTKGKLLGSKNLMNIFNNFFSIALCSVMYAFVLALGELDLSVGAIVGFSAAMAALASNLSIYLIFPIAILIGLLIGSLNGFFTAYLNVESFIGTLAMSFICRGLTTYFLNGSVGIPIGMRTFDQNWIKVLAVIVVAVIAGFLFNKCAFGKHCRAVGASHAAAQQSGVNVKKTRMIAFALVGLVCGLIGFFTLVRACTASSKTGNAFEFDVLLAVLFGGMPLSGGWSVKFRAAIVGSLAMAILESGMSLYGIDGLVQQIVRGVILIVVVALSFDRKSTGVIK
ncbi:MAG: ABC transporter permease [Lachnospiraceae bacterium]|nr:ABC transporter permease [Lachnospiraceae bacterium]